MEDPDDILQCFVESSVYRNVGDDDEFNGILGHERCNFGVGFQFFDRRFATNGNTNSVADFKGVDEDGEADEACGSCDLN
jgi:hypothetical protein